MIKVQNLKLVILLEYKLVWRSFSDKKIKSTVPWAYAITDLKGKEFVWPFYEKEL